MFDNKLWIVFVANNNSNELLVCSSSDGQNWSSSTEVQQSSKATHPLAVFDNKLWIVFVANDDSNELLVCSSSDGQNWSSSTEVQQSSKAAPALAVFDNKLWIVFVANNNSNELLVCSSSDEPEMELQHRGPAVEQGRPRSGRVRQQAVDRLRRQQQQQRAARLQFQRWPELELQHRGPAVEQGRPRHLWPGSSNTQPDDLAALGVGLYRMAEAARWLMC